MAVVEVSVSTCTPIIGTILHVQSLAQGGVLNGVLQRFLILVDVTHIVVVVGTGVSGKREGFNKERSCESEVSTDAPVAIDILRLRDTSTRCLIIFRTACDAVSGGRKAHVGIEVLHRCGEIVVPIHVDVRVERRLQIRITHADIERIRCISHVEEVGHVRLTSRTTIANTQGVLPIEAVAEVERRRKTPVVATCHRVESLIVVVNLLMLFLDVHTHIHVDGSGDETKLQFEQMSLVLILRVSAQVIIEVIPVIVWKIASSSATNGVEEKLVISEIVSGTIRMTILITETVLRLQEEFLGNQRLGIIGTYAIVLIGIWSGAIAVGHACGIAKLIVAHIAEVVALAFAG